MDITPANAPHQSPSVSSVTTRWQCRACSSEAPNLLVLPSCGHRFCMACVEKWLWEFVCRFGGCGREYPCQLCSARYTIPPDGLDAFVQNYHVLQLESQLQTLSMSPAAVGQTPNVQKPIHIDIMKNASGVCSGDFTSYEENQRSNLSIVPYCQLSNHMF